MMHIPKTSVAGNTWPAIVDPRAAQALSIQYQLQQSQWWSAQALQKMQLTQLGPLVAHAYETTPFYRQHFRQHNFKPSNTITPEQWSDIPVVTRAEIQLAGEELLSSQIPSEHGELGEMSTSGSTGMTVVIKTTSMSQLFWHAFNLRDHKWHQRNLTGRLCAIRRSFDNEGKLPHGSSGDSWGASTDVAYKTGPSHLLDIRATIDEQLNWLQRHNPDYVLLYPSSLDALAIMAQKRGIQLPKLHQVRTFGELVSEETRRRCQAVFNAPLIDAYSCQEVGYLALQCSDFEHYHVQSEGVLLEVLDDQDNPCQPGETGRVVISSLHNYAMPLIRYELGDYAEVGHPCACGRGLPVLKKILGRQRNILQLPDGRKIWPLVGSDSYRNIADIRQFQLAQIGPRSIEVRLVVGALLSVQQEQALGAVIRRTLGDEFQLNYRYLDEIPRSKSGKFEDFISLPDAEL